MHRRALIVEHDSATGLLLAQVLRGCHFDPLTLPSGASTLACARQQRPDVIFLGADLPNTNGYAICEDLKLDRDTNLIPLILVIREAASTEPLRGLLVGPNCYLTKPFTPEDVHRALGEAQAWRAQIERSGGEGEIHFRFPSHTRYLEELNHLLSSLFLFTGLSQSQIKHFTMAIREIGVNAIEWGHHNEVNRIVTAIYRIDSQKVSVVIRDTGPGFDPGDVPHAARPDDPLTHLGIRERLGLRDGGFGILIARGLVDELQFNASGNEVRLVKYFNVPRQVSSSDPRPA